MVKDYRIEVKVRNNKLLEKIEEAGYETVAAFCRDANFDRNVIGRFVNMKQAPINALTGEYSRNFMKIVDFLKCFPEDIFPKAQMQEAMKVNKLTTKADVSDVQNLSASLRSVAILPEQKMILDEAKKTISRALETLTPKEQRVLDLRYGLTFGEEKTLEEIAGMFGVSRERIRNIEQKALRKMRHPKRSNALRANLNELLVGPLDQK